MDVEAFLTVACELLAAESTGDRPAELNRALGLVLDFVGPGFSVEWFESGGKIVERTDPPHRADTHRPEIDRLQAAARSQGYTGEFLRKHGTGDSRFYSLHGITSVAFGIGGAGQHGPEEYADITTIVPYYQALTEFLRCPSRCG
jgi:acetylornithine deacetylase/succinyl-diaminopimelate desuccinylase-like protein